MRYTGTTGKGFYGDKAKAVSYMGTARLLVGRLMQRLKAAPFNGRGHLTDRQRMDDGSWVHTLVSMQHGVVPVVRTWIESPLNEYYSEEYPISLGLLIESGLIISNQSADVENEQGVPLILLSSDDQAYFSSGTPYYGRSLYINGKDWTKTTAGSRYASSVYKETMQMADTDPALWPDGAANSPINYGVNSVSSVYTGLMRLAVQAKLGIGGEESQVQDGVSHTYSLANLFPWDAPPPPINLAYLFYGLFRTEDYTYFVFHTSDSGCKACRMTIGDEVQWIKDWLSEGVASQDDAEKLEAVVLSTLKPELDQDENLVEFDLLGASDVKPTRSPAIEGALAYNWHYSYSGNEIRVIRHGGVMDDDDLYTATSYQTTITISFSKDEEDKYVPSASAETITHGEWVLDHALLSIWTPFIYHGFSLYSYLPDVNWHGLTGPVNVPIYGYYTKDGWVPVTVHYEYTPGTEYHSPPLEDRYVCEAMSTTSILGYGGKTAIGFSVGEDDGRDFYDDEQTEYVCNVFVGAHDFVLGGTFAAADSSNATLINSDCSTILRLGMGYRKEYSDIGVTVAADARKTYINTTAEVGIFVSPLSKSLIIPRLNAESVMVASRRSEVETIESVYPILERPFYTRKKVEYYSDNTYTTLVAEIESPRHIAVVGGSYLSSGIWTGDSPGGSNRILLLDPVTTTTTAPREYDATLYLGTERVDLTDGDAWNAYFYPERVTDFIGFSVQQSWDGNAIYPTHWLDNNPTLKVSMAQSDSVLDATTVRWIGWA